MSIQQYAAAPEIDPSEDDQERVLKHDFEIDRENGEDIHDRLVEYVYDVLKMSSRADHTVAGDDITGLQDDDGDPSGRTVRAYRQEMERLFGYEDDTGRYSVVKELPYYHLTATAYPDDVATDAIDGYIRSAGSAVSETVAAMPPQEIGDMDVAVFDRETRTVYLTEVKGHRRYMEDGKDAVDKFAAYADAFGWDVAGNVVVFNETARRNGNMLLIGNIEGKTVCDTRWTE